MTHVLYLLLASATLLWGYNVGQLTPRIISDDYQAAQAVCDYSHTVNSGEWEEACGTALDATNTRYACKPICNVKELK